MQLFCSASGMLSKLYLKKICDLDILKDKIELLRKLLHELMYSANDAKYTAIKQKVFDASNKEFEEYFLKNWESCKCMWVSYKRDEYMHLANTTLESHN